MLPVVLVGGMDIQKEKQPGGCKAELDKYKRNEVEPSHYASKWYRLTPGHHFKS